VAASQRIGPGLESYRWLVADTESGRRWPSSTRPTWPRSGPWQVATDPSGW